MKKLYPTLRRFVLPITALILLTFFNTGVAQQKQGMEPGIVRIKVREELAVQLERSRMARTTDNVVVTGIEALDKFNQQYQVTDFRRVFRPAGKFEAKHRKHGLHRWYEIRMNKGASIVQAITSYQSMVQIEKAEPSYKKAIIGSDHKNFGPVAVAASGAGTTTLPGASNDAMLGSQWHYHNTGQTGGTSGADIDLFNAWQLETGRREVIVAITDGGIQVDHPDLAANLWVNEDEIAGNGIDDDGNGFVDDVNGYSFVDNNGTIAAEDHGTHVAGTVAAVTNNGIGVAGVAGGSGSGDGVRVMSCAVFNDAGEGGFSETYLYGADQGAVISQNSWGYLSPGVYEQSVLDAIDYFIEEAGKDEHGDQVGPMNGGIVIFAAGNDGSDDNYYPGYYARTLAVAATTHQDKKAYYSNYGAWVDIAAPGGETDVSTERGVMSTLAGGQYGSYQGTSMACPHVSGVAALLVSKYGNAGFSPDLLRARLLQTADNIDVQDPLYAGALGAGRLNAYAALLQNDNTPPPPVTNLAVTGSEIGKVTLTWTAPADGESFIAAYDIRYSPSPITAANFESAITVSDEPFPNAPGSTETFTVTGLAGGTRYYFAIKCIDFGENSGPVSNVVSEVTPLSPVIDVSPDSLTVHLQTAHTSTQTLTIRNTGPGPLKFTVTAPGVDDFASYPSTQGALAPDSSQDLTVTFDASGLLAGTYHQSLPIQSNDPLRGTVSVPLTLIVSNNNAPIVSITPDSIHFKSVQTGMSSSRTVTVHNAGSNTLTIDPPTSGNPSFTTDLTGTLQLGAFEDTTITITFSPTAVGFTSTVLMLHTNDPVSSMLQVYLDGEGLSMPPLVVTPSSIEEILENGQTSTQTIIVKNNGSYDRTFAVEIKDMGVDKGFLTAGRVASSSSSSVTPLPAARKKEAVLAAIASQPAELRELLTPVGAGNASNARVKKNNGGAQVLASPGEPLRYSTDFENFATGSLDGQEDWFALRGWTIEKGHSSSGEKHLQGAAVPTAEQSYCISPNLPAWDENGPLFNITSVSMKVNRDSSSGVTWQIIPQDPQSFVATRIRFSDNGTVEALVVNKDYEMIWKDITDEVPSSGYFDLAIEMDNRGNDTTGFSIFGLYINSKKILAGASLAATISQVAMQTQSERSGPTLAIDDLTLVTDEYIPAYIMTDPPSGNIPAGGSAAITLTFNATDMKFGMYRSEILIRPDDAEPVVIPVSMSVTGNAALKIEPGSFYGVLFPGDSSQYSLKISNAGGVPLTYRIHEDAPWLHITPDSSYLPVRGYDDGAYGFTSQGMQPGIYVDTVLVSTDAEDTLSIEIPADLIIWESRAKASVTPQSLKVQAIQGETVSSSVQMQNLGEGILSFDLPLVQTIYPLPPWVSVSPQAGKATALNSQEVTITFRTDTLKPGTHTTHVYFRTNDPQQQSIGVDIDVEILPDNNHAPVFEDIEDDVLAERESHELIINAADEDDDDVSIALHNAPSFVTLRTSSNGTATYDIAPPLGAAGEYSLLAIATDARGKTDSASFRIRVTPYGVSGFSLIDAQTGEVIADFDGEVTVDLADLDHDKLLVRANTAPQSVGSVAFLFQRKKAIENSAPYEYKLPSLESLGPGKFVLNANTYTKPKGKGEQGRGRLAVINVVNTVAVLKLEVVNTTGAVLKVLQNGDVIDIGDPAYRNITIRADVGDKQVKNVMFLMSNGYTHKEKRVPYTLYGDSRGRYNRWNARTGRYTLKAIPNWHAWSGQPLTVSFTVVDKSSNQYNNSASPSVPDPAPVTREEVLLEVFPVPVKDELNVQLTGSDAGEVTVMISSIYGQSYFKQIVTREQLRTLRVSTERLGLIPGIYYVHIVGATGGGLVRKFVKE